ncbi:transducin-like enhancer protein 1 [Sycon ciliatum]|uniref:transducin-like enhancer protein 1 n=1 Tax=Sycon ciliatum TaxID=27933 RepID=UPI0031F67525
MSSSSPSFQDHLEKAMDNYRQVEKEVQRLSSEVRKLEEEKGEMTRQCVLYAEMLNALNLEKATHMEISKRLEGIIQANISAFPQEHQQGLMETVSRAKQVDSRELYIHMQSQAVPSAALGQQQQPYAVPVPGNGVMYVPPGAHAMPPHGAMVTQAPRYAGEQVAPGHGGREEYVNDSREISSRSKRDRKRKHNDHSDRNEAEEDMDEGAKSSESGHHANGVRTNTSASPHGSGRDSRPASERDQRDGKRKSGHDSSSSVGVTSAPKPSHSQNNVQQSTAPAPAAAAPGQAQPMHLVSTTRPPATVVPAAAGGAAVPAQPVVSADGQIVYANGPQMTQVYTIPPGMRPPFMPQHMQVIPQPYTPGAAGDMSGTAAAAAAAAAAAGYPAQPAAPPGAYYQIPAGFPRPPFDPSQARSVAISLPQQSAAVTQPPMSAPAVAAPAAAAPQVAQAAPVKQPITYRYHEQTASVIAPQADFYSQSGMPRSHKTISTLHHNDVVCAVSIDSKSRRVFTGGRGKVKVWNFEHANPEHPLSQFDILDESYIRSCKMLPDGKTMIVGGESTKLAIYDIEGMRPVGELVASAPACYAVATSADGMVVYSCCSNGQIVMWDMRTRKVIQQLPGHSDGASCLDLAKDGTRLVTGGLDSKVRLWDTRQMTEMKCYKFDSQVFSIGYTSMSENAEKYFAVGLENSTIELFNINRSDRYVSHLHEDSVLSLKFAASGKWFVTTSKDTKLGVWGMPYGANLFHSKDYRSILCCDVSADDKYIITGSGHNRAILYEVVYN